MLSDKELKRDLKEKTSLRPEKYYPIDALQGLGFERRHCKCGNWFWSINPNRLVCGEAKCSGGFGFIGKSPSKAKLDYIGVWKRFSELFNKLGYKPIKRYPVVARWRDDADFVQASIYDFQPYVVNGLVKPPANPLVVPQFCLRFNDIDNVGITGAHYTGFVMIGQHAFMPPKDYDINKYLMDIHEWLGKGLKISDNEIIFHEDAWAGGGNFGSSMEFFSRGLELGNQVYMQYEQTASGSRELNLKVLDMGMGQERNAWFSMGANTSYETTFPTVIKKLKGITGVKEDGILKKFLPYSSFLNIDEIKESEKVWMDISKSMHVDVIKLKKTVLPLAALYSIAEHSRSILIAISDGALPSNTGGGYNLRVILRRMLSFIEEYGWKIEPAKLCELHAAYLKPQFPELRENLQEVIEILGVEKNKFFTAREKARQIVARLKGKRVSENELIELYDSQGIQPEMIKKEVGINIPENFYAKVAERHAVQKVKEEKEFTMYIEIPQTKGMYYTNVYEFDAKVVDIIDDCIMLDKSAFYPTSGGQQHDTGYIGESRVIDVFKQGNVIVHKVDGVKAGKGDIVKCKIDKDRREILTQHHTAAHIVNAAARKILGNHVWQAGAEKTVEKGRLDITHYAQLSSEEISKIGDEANNLIKRGIQINKKFMPRDKAEQTYGMRLYQGGAVPGSELRIVSILGVDNEACGGTHCDNTKEVGAIKILKASKISDAIVRIEYTAGAKALEAVKKENDLLGEIAKLLKVKPEEIPERTKELFEKWKEKKKGKTVGNLSVKKITKGSTRELLDKTAEALKTQPEHILKTIERFLKELGLG